MSRFAVVGLGRIGLASLFMLNRLGYEAYGVSNTMESVEAARSLGLEAYLGDIVANPHVLDRHGGADVVLLALPGSVGFRGLKGLVGAGYNVVDVSFFPEDPGPLGPLAEERGVTVVVDAGVAPGLSNMLVARAKRLYDIRGAHIFVGAISRDPNAPLGLTSTWSVSDLLEEYIRPARMIVNGEVKKVMPLDAPVGKAKFEGLGVLEYAPTDGLRSLLYTIGRDMDELVEYTLRWEGHYELVKSLDRIGLLSSRRVNVDGCPVEPRACLARVLEHVLPRGNDLVVLVVEGWRDGKCIKYTTIVTPRNFYTAISLATSSFHVSSALLLAEGYLRKGLIYPEELGMDKRTSSRVIRFLESQGVVVAERSGGLEVCIQPPGRDS
ncbi:MAG: hypothetical protein F7C35_03740 [Desulfurococcales archaeon]|nr:hypothetical protein [Desulfurococcales archaeon]